jgi:hypothetical protein
MSDTPKFEVIDRRKFKVEEEGAEPAQAESAPGAESEKLSEAAAPAAGPRLVTPEPQAAAAQDAATSADEHADDATGYPGMPAPPTAEESREQKDAYEASSQRLEDLVRAQNPAAGPQPPVTFEHLVQQLYLSSMIQMGAGTQEGQRPRVDILGAKQTIDLLGVVEEKTRGNLTSSEARVLDTMLFEARMAFLELTTMISMPGVPPAPPPPGKR